MENNVTPKPADILVIELIQDGFPIAAYACLRSEYSEVTQGNLRGFAINSQIIKPSLGHLNGFPEYWEDTTVFWAGERYFAQKPPDQLASLAEQIRALGITISPALLKDVLFNAIGLTVEEVALMETQGRVARIPLNPPAAQPETIWQAEAQ